MNEELEEKKNSKCTKVTKKTSSTRKGKTYSDFLQRARIKVIAPNPLKKKRVMI